MEIGKQLQFQRKQRNMSQEDLARKLNISRQSISKWESGAALPSFANVIAISELFDISLDELIKGDTTLMEKFEHDSKINKALLITIVGIALALVAFIISSGIFHISESKLNDWLILPTTISFVAFAWSIKWKNIDKIISKWTVILGIIWLALVMWPNVYSFWTGFVTGFNNH
ncbi:helix-turn-helix transcriptional regulator [Companilactobacillus zhachilii]|uniref:helix-turn-helix domain-containing protein n=1 Tax=Companilactobacillus zhachilii TaxID=2304606 RepID=UPI001924C9E7|nr:helix-turn-helix domain-containing protein [Companilactobacillus zhachilii]MBL3531010.1 helix-turn-helix transcriptional regulator [Companilactobacillus zhachilii]